MYSSKIKPLCVRACVRVCVRVCVCVCVCVRTSIVSRRELDFHEICYEPKYHRSPTNLYVQVPTIRSSHALNVRNYKT
jgi:hypothetical protein